MLTGHADTYTQVQLHLGLLTDQRIGGHPGYNVRIPPRECTQGKKHVVKKRKSNLVVKPGKRIEMHIYIASYHEHLVTIAIRRELAARAVFGYVE